MISMLMARHDGDDDDKYICVYAYMCVYILRLQ